MFVRKQPETPLFNHLKKRQVICHFANECWIMKTQAYHPLSVLRTCASCILMAASVVYKGFCEYDN